MRNVIVMVLVLAVLVMGGCAKVVGPYYLEQEKYEEGVRVMSDQLKENPDDASSAYYVGRYYLAMNKPKDGLPYLEKAAKLDPENADYVFWTGVAYWAMLDFEREKAAYIETLRLDPDHISANLYLGHGFIDQGEWAKALAQYDKVIKLDRYNPEALYNRALALSELGKKKEEIAAWKKFLEFYPDGTLAMQATEQLNLHGDFTYRNFIFGQRNVTLRSMTFKPGTDSLDADCRASLHVISAMLKANKKLAMHVVAYTKGDKNLAKARAKAVQGYMVSGNPDIDPKRLPLSWFGTAEEIEIGDKKFSVDESVQFITVVR